MPIDRGVLDQQLQALGEGPRWWECRELRDLPNVLRAEERILAIGRGRVARVRILRREWLVLVTDERLLCIRSSRATWRQLEVDASHISRTSIRVGPFRGRVIVNAQGRTLRLLLPRDEAHRIQHALARLNPPGSRTLPGTPAGMVRQVFDHILALPAALDSRMAPSPPPAQSALPPGALGRMEERMEAMEDQIQELRKQIEFLEQLLQRRHAAESDVAVGVRDRG